MRTKLMVFTVVGFSTLLWNAVSSLAEPVLGYTDTPMLPSGKWHVHDPDRPRPVVVTPGEKFSNGAAAPSDAVILFDGSDLSKFRSEKNGAAPWKVENGYVECVPETGYIHTAQEFGDFQLHLEFCEPPPVGDSQDRGNSGIFLHGIYEVQVLDCYNNPTYPDGQTAAIYGQSPPLVNACRKPGEWQTYDIVFEGPRFDESKKLQRPARVTVIHNGVLVQNHQAILGPTGHRTLAKYDGSEPERGPLALQDHGNRIRYRNIWIREIAQEEQP